MMKEPDFLYVNNSWKLKNDCEILGWVCSKIGVTTLVT